MDRFSDIKQGFSQIFSDRHWLWKILLGGCLLINPLLLILAPHVFNPAAASGAKLAFGLALLFNLLSFWFPLGFTFEVLRRARFGNARQLPDWRRDLLLRYAREGAAKLVIAIGTVLLPAALWTSLAHAIFVCTFHLPPALLKDLSIPIFSLVIPFCGVGCCRWLDGAPVLDCAFNYTLNLEIFLRRWQDFLIASIFISGVQNLAASFYYTLPFAVVFSLCVVDTWFGPTYAEIASKQQELTPRV
ncbi:MAG: hypothetical protein PHV34_17470 [Verrucomicrobiae bacterium]|nr:hypothetical protein [Verrucomicrobiae bacterium]